MTDTPSSLPRAIPGAVPRGILLMILTAFLFSVMDSTAKGLVARHDPAQVVWVRFIGQLGLTLLILRHSARRFLRTAHPGLHLLRGLFQLGAISFFFLSLRHIGIAEATAIADVSPVLITLGAALFLGERLGPRRIFGVGLALIGALIVIRPGAGSFTPWAVLPFLCAVCYSLNAILTRRLGPGEPVWTAMLWGAATGTLLTSLYLPLVWTPIAAADLPAFAVVGLTGTLAQLCLIRAYSLAEAGTIAPFTYLGLVFATLWGMLFFDEWPDQWTVIGALIIVGAGLYVGHRETQRPRGRGMKA